MTSMNFELLMVDDDELFLVLNKRELVKSGFHLEPKSFLDAEGALNYLKSLDQPNKKILIFLDINMPEIDGWQFLKKLQELQLNLHIKHVLVTSSTDPKDRIIAKDFPEIIGFLEKPIDRNMLQELSEQPSIREFIEG